MKTLLEIDQMLHAFEKKFGLTVRGVQQLSEAWFHLKLGVVSMSNISKAVAGKKTDTRSTYMMYLIAQICCGVIEEQDFKQMEWGRQHEDAARAMREFASGKKITPVSFVFRDDTFRVGCSPDGVTIDEPEEFKCPWNSANYVKFLLEEKQKPEWVWQNQGTLWVMKADVMNTTHYDPRMKVKPIHTVRVEKDPDYQTQLDETIPEFIEDMDKLLAQLGVTFGDQWTRLAKAQEAVA